MSGLAAVLEAPMAQEKSVKYPHLFSLPSFPLSLLYLFYTAVLGFILVWEVGADTPFAG